MNWIKSKIVRLPTKDESCVLKNKYIMAGNQILPYSEMQKLHSEGIDAELELRGFEHQHLYFTSDEEIKEGDWVFNEDYGIGKVKDTSDYGKANAHLLTVDGYHWHFSGSKKIIATTDPKLCQPITKAQYEEIRISRNKLRDLYESSMQRNTYLDQIKKLDIQLSSYEKKLPQPSQSFIKEYCDAGGIDEVMVEYELITDQCDGQICDTCNCQDGIKINTDNTINIRKIKDSWSREEVENLLNRMYVEFAAYPTMNVDIKNKWIEQNL